MSNNKNSVSYNDIYNAAKLLSTQFDQEYIQDSFSWLRFTDFTNEFQSQYSSFYDLQINRPWGLPYDLSIVPYSGCINLIQSMVILTNFINTYYTPFINLLKNNLNLVSSGTQQNFREFLSTPIYRGSKMTMIDLGTSLSVFSDYNNLTPKFSDIEESFNVLLWLATIGTESEVLLDYFDYYERGLEPAKGNSQSLGSESDGLQDSPVSFEDIQAAANNMIDVIKNGGLNFIVNQFSEIYFNQYFADLNQYGLETTTCDAPNNIQREEYPAVLDVNYVLNKISGFFKVYFLPYYNLILNNQNLLSKESLSWWNYNFNAVTMNGTERSVISTVYTLMQYLDLSTLCPVITEDQSQSFFILFKFWTSANFREILLQTFDKLTSADDFNSSKTDANDSSDLFSDVQTFSTQAASDSLAQSINQWTGMSILDFTSYYNIYIKDSSSPVKSSISNILDSLDEFNSSVGKLIISIDSQIENNPSIISASSKLWWEDNFIGNVLQPSSTVLMCLWSFANTMLIFRDPENTSPIEEGDEVWNSFVSMYEFTPWDDSNPIRAAMIDAVKNITPA